VPPRRILAAAAVLAGMVLALTGAVAALADDADPAVTWSVQPSDGAGPDGRAWIEQTLDPGESALEHLAVHNFSDRKADFHLAAADGFFNQNGRFNILPSDQPSSAAGTWIELPDAVSVPAGETVVVPLTITVPKNAEPGDHAAGVAASIKTTSTGEAGASVGVESRVGFRVMVRVTGDLTSGATIRNVVTTYQTSWNPFAPGDVTVDFDVVNTGNTRLRATGVVTAVGRETTFPPEDEPQELLVGDARHFTVTVNDTWPTLLVPVSLTIDPEVVAISGDAPELAAVHTETTAFAMPWPQLALVAGVALVVGALLWRRGRSRQRLDGLLQNAREEGRRTALTAKESS
jgi:hypothetical protein